MSITGIQIKKQIKRSDYTYDEAAKLLGMSRQNLYGYFTNYEITDDFLKNVKDKLGISFDEQSNDSEKNKPFIINEPLITVNNFDNNGGVPYYDSDFIDIIATVEKTKANKFINIPGFEDCDFWIQAFGPDMSPLYTSSDLIGCKKINNKLLVPFGKAFLIQLSDGNKYIRYIRRTSDKEVWSLVPENPKFDPMDVNITDVTDCWIIKGSIKKDLI